MNFNKRIFLWSLIAGLLLPHSMLWAQESSPLTPLTIGTSSQKVPAGTLLKIAFNSHMDSRITQPGEPFTASILEDFATTGPDGQPHVILPTGTYVRGRVAQVKKPNFLSHGGSINLDFDHVVLPSGELLPLDLHLSTNNTIVNQKGALYSDPGIGKKVNQSVHKGMDTFNKFKDAGVQAGKSTAGGIGMLMTVPISVAGGAIAGTAVTTGKTVVSIIGKGDSVIIQPGDSVTIDFGGSFNLPSE